MSEQRLVQARKLLVEIRHPVVGAAKVVNSEIKLANASADVHGLPPEVGKHSAEAVREVAGCDPSEVDRLFAAGVLYSTDPRAPGGYPA